MTSVSRFQRIVRLRDLIPITLLSISSFSLRTLGSLAAALLIASTAAAGAGDPRWESIGPYAGTAACIVVDPSPPGIVYAGTGVPGLSGAGIFRSMDRGSSWERSAAGSIVVSGITTVAVDPNSSSTVYATGWAAGGVYRSFDGGTTWLCGGGSGLTPHLVDALAVDAGSGQTVYAASYNNFFKSTDGGATWTSKTNGLQLPSGHPVMVADPHVPGVIYLTFAPYGVFKTTTPYGVFKTTNAAESWNAVNTGLTSLAVRALAIDPRTSWLYAGTAAGVFLSADSAASWHSIGGPPLVVSLAVNSADSANLFAAADGQGAFRTNDGGASWSAINNGVVFFHGGDAPGVESIAYDSRSATLYAGTDRFGVYRSVNKGDSWVPSNQGLTNADIYSISVDPHSDGTLFAGDISGRVFRTHNGGMSWDVSKPFGGLNIESVFVVPFEPSTILVGVNFGNAFRSADGGDTWDPMPGLGSERGQPTLCFAADSRSSIYAGTDGFVHSIYKSLDGGLHWSDSSEGITGSILAIAVDPSDDAVIYAADDKGGVFKSVHGGSGWTKVATFSSRVGGSAGAVSLAIDPRQPSIVYASVNGAGTFKSLNGGSTWSLICQSISADVCSGHVIVDPDNSTLYLATDSFQGGSCGVSARVYKSTDGGVSWSPFNDGFTGGFTRSFLLSDASSKTLYLGTQASIFRLSFPERGKVVPPSARRKPTRVVHRPG